MYTILLNTGFRNFKWNIPILLDTGKRVGVSIGHVVFALGLKGYSDFACGRSIHLIAFGIALSYNPGIK